MSNIEHIPTRSVLIEKGPHFVEVLDNLDSIDYWWYEKYVGKILEVKQAVSEDLGCLHNVDIYKISDVSIVIGGCNLMYIGAAILNKNIKRVIK